MDIEISLIIPFYKKIEFLELILQGLKKQSYKNFEIIIAEDDNAQETKEFIQKISKNLFFPIKHLFQNDEGFRKSKIMNKAIVEAQGKFIIFLDGDCIPHRHFVKEYAKNKEENKALFGRRVFLSKQITNKLIQNKSINSINIVNLLLSKSKAIEEAIYLPFRKYGNSYRGICGCNWGVSKQNLIDINGFDEDYLYAGTAEDLDVEWRLIQNGIQLKKMKNKAIVYHLYHDRNYTYDQELINLKLLEKKKEKNEIYCSNGINKHNKN